MNHIPWWKKRSLKIAWVDKSHWLRGKREPWLALAATTRGLLGTFGDGASETFGGLQRQLESERHF